MVHEPGPRSDDELELQLPPDATAALRAREAVRRALERWRLPHLVETCVLVVSELVTNAVRYGRPPLGLQMRRRGSNVEVEVHDEGTGEVVDLSSDPEEMAESGRGLGLVRALADESAIEAVPGGGTTARAAWKLERSTEPSDRPS